MSQEELELERAISGSGVFETRMRAVLDEQEPSSILIEISSVVVVVVRQMEALINQKIRGDN